jgi:ParB-like chromosome segregation protein Spo0J
MPPLTLEEHRQLKESIREHGVLVPIEYDEHGNILDGYHRIEIAAELGIADWPKITRSGLSENEKRQHARTLNLARRHLTRQDKAKLIEDQLRDTPEQSDRKIADDMKVDHKTVSKRRRKLESTGAIPQLPKTIGADGKARPTKNPKTNVRQQQVITLRQALKSLQDAWGDAFPDVRKQVCRERNIDFDSLTALLACSPMPILARDAAAEPDNPEDVAQPNPFPDMPPALDRRANGAGS